MMARPAVPLAGLASLVWALTKSGHETKARRHLRKWWRILGSLLLAYGLLGFVRLDPVVQLVVDRPEAEVVLQLSGTEKCLGVPDPNGGVRVVGLCEIKDLKKSQTF